MSAAAWWRGVCTADQNATGTIGGIKRENTMPGGYIVQMILGAIIGLFGTAYIQERTGRDVRMGGFSAHWSAHFLALSVWWDSGFGSIIPARGIRRATASVVDGIAGGNRI